MAARKIRSMPGSSGGRFASLVMMMRIPTVPGVFFHSAIGVRMTAPLITRPAVPTDHPQLCQAIIELQEYERLRHATRLPGEQIADAYLAWLQRQAATQGAILVAERGGTFIGFVAGWIEQADNIGETPDS